MSYRAHVFHQPTLVMTRKPTSNCLPFWVLLPVLPAPTSLQVIRPVHSILRGLPSFAFSWAPQPASLPVSDGKLFITLPFLVRSLSVWTHGSVCGWYSWCWTCGLSCSRSGIDDLPGNLSHNPGSSPVSRVQLSQASCSLHLKPIQ